MSIIFILSLIVLTSLLDTGNQALLKSAINSLGFNIKSLRHVFSFIAKLILIPRVWLGFLLSTASLITWLFVLSKADLNFAFSADSMHYIFIAFISRKILKERVGGKRWLGTLFIIIGITLITWGNR